MAAPILAKKQVFVVQGLSPVVYTYDEWEIYPDERMYDDYCD